MGAGRFGFLLATTVLAVATAGFSACTADSDNQKPARVQEQESVKAKEQQQEQQHELAFDIREGDTLNAFYRRGPIAAHLVLSTGKSPRALVAFPAGNSGVGLWFQPTAKPIAWNIHSRPRGVTEQDQQGRPLRGIQTDIETDATRLVIREGVLSSVRVLRDYHILGTRPDQVATDPRVAENALHWTRPRLDGAPGYALRLEVLQGQIVVERAGANTSGKDPAQSSDVIALTANHGQPLRLRLTAMTGETPLTPIDPAQLLSETAADDPRSRNALAFLSYREKFLAGSWRFDTYFGRDTLMSLRLLLPALTPEAVEAGLGSVLARLNPAGEVAHEEDIGEFAVLRHQREGRSSAQPIYDYVMIDDDFMLAPTAAAYLLDDARGRARAESFLAQKNSAGERYGDLLSRNFAWVAAAAAPFAQTPDRRHLITLKPGKQVGQWRDSMDGLGAGRYAYDVNAVFVPAALTAITRFVDAGLLKPYLNADRSKTLSGTAHSAQRWQQAAPMFEVEIAGARAQAAITDYAKTLQVDATPALATVQAQQALQFNAIALDQTGRPIPILHSDDGFALLFLDPPPAALNRAVDSMMRPFPAGLMTDIGLLVANPVYGDARLQQQLGRNAYHGTVVWAWQQAVLAAGLNRQLGRNDLPEATRARLIQARTRLWTAIDNARDVRTSELWSWSYADGRYQVAPFGQSGDDQDESNAAQLWSTVFLALQPPAQ